MRTDVMLAVADVEQSSAWYQRLLGLCSGHGGPCFHRRIRPTCDESTRSDCRRACALLPLRVCIEEEDPSDVR